MYSNRARDAVCVCAIVCCLSYGICELCGMCGCMWSLSRSVVNLCRSVFRNELECVRCAIGMSFAFV